MQDLEQTLAHWRVTQNEIRLFGESTKEEDHDDDRGGGDEADHTSILPIDQQQGVPEGEAVANPVGRQLQATVRALIEQEDVMENCIERCENGHLETIGLFPV